MKRKIKILFITAILAGLALLMAIPAFASDEASAEEIVQTEDAAVEESSSKELESKEAEGLPTYDEESERNIFQLIYDTALEYAAEIFSFLSLIGTLIISYFYKRGLLPSVKTAISGIGSAVGKIKESSDRQCESQKQDAEKATERFAELESTITAFGEKLTALEEHLIGEEEIQKQIEKSDIILSSQIDMLYDIFMSSSIPHYQKEATGERIVRMRKEIESYEEA